MRLGLEDDTADTEDNLVRMVSQKSAGGLKDLLKAWPAYPASATVCANESLCNMMCAMAAPYERLDRTVTVWR